MQVTNAEMEEMLERAERAERLKFAEEIYTVLGQKGELRIEDIRELARAWTK